MHFRVLLTVLGALVLSLPGYCDTDVIFEPSHSDPQLEQIWFTGADGNEYTAALVAMRKKDDGTVELHRIEKNAEVHNGSIGAIGTFSVQFIGAHLPVAELALIIGDTGCDSVACNATGAMIQAGAGFSGYKVAMGYGSLVGFGGKHFIFLPLAGWSAKLVGFRHYGSGEPVYAGIEGTATVVALKATATVLRRFFYEDRTDRPDWLYTLGIGLGF